MFCDVLFYVVVSYIIYHYTYILDFVLIFHVCHASSQYFVMRIINIHYIIYTNIMYFVLLLKPKLCVMCFSIKAGTVVDLQTLISIIKQSIQCRTK